MSNTANYRALIWAIQNRSPLNEILTLIQSGIDVNIQNKFGETALMNVVWCGGEHAEEIIRGLVDAKADVNKQNNLGQTTLMHAARFGREYAVGMMRLLLDAGADANTQDDEGVTALMYATRFGGEHTMEMIHLLIDAYANINIQTNKGKTASDIALYDKIDDDNIKALLRPSLVKSGAPSDSLFGSGGGGGGDGTGFGFAVAERASVEEHDEEIKVHSYTKTHEDGSTKEVEYAFPSPPEDPIVRVFSERVVTNLLGNRPESAVEDTNIDLEDTGRMIRLRRPKDSPSLPGFGIYVIVDK
jgi:ankyrin repeat protein